MGADMEMSCDERVMRELGGEIKNAYSLSLVRVAAGRKILNGSPLAFGEGGMKERVKNVLNFKKPSHLIIVLAVALMAVLSVGFAVNQVSGKQPFKDINTDEITSILLYCSPPDVSVSIEDKSTISEIAEILRTVVTYEKDYLGEMYAGQLVQYTLTMQSGEAIEIGALGSFIVIDGQRYKTKYEPSEELNRLGNQLRGDKKSPYQQAMDIINEHYPEASEIISSGSETIIYADSSESVDVYTFDVVINGERVICAISKDSGIFFTYNNKTGWVLPSLGDRRPMVLIEDLIYMDTGKEVSVETDKIATLGTILSSVDASKIPTQNGQSNFGCVGSDYAYYEDGIIVKINGKWFFFVAESVNLGNVALQNEKVSQRVEGGLRIIMSSPLTSSNPQDYINEHGQEYEDLTAKYPDGVLEYLLSQFEVDNADGLRGQIMMRMCKDMLGLQNNVTDESLSPQEWYKQLSIISEIILPDFKPENPTGVYNGEVDGKVYGDIFNSAIVQYYGNSERGFLVYAPTIYGAYEEDGKLKAFVTVDYKYYRLYGKTLENTGGGVIPGAIVFAKDSRTGEWVFEEYLEVGTAGMPDGMYYNDSIQKLCVMPVSGKEINGLADKMISDYVDASRNDLLTQSLKEHLTEQGQTGVSWKKRSDETIPLT